MNTKKQQVVLIHGGETFDKYEDYLTSLHKMDFDPNKDLTRSKRWNRQLGNNLGNSYEYIFPTMPNKYNSKYIEWKIWFEKVLDYVDDGFILIGHSLGGTFLVKYLSENKINKKIKKLILVSAVISDPVHNRYQLDTFVINYDLIKNICNNVNKITIIHSKDDNEVPFNNFEELIKYLPKAKQMIFKDRGHFLGESFQEIVEEIKTN